MLLFLTGFVCILGVTLQTTDAASCHLREVDLCLATVLLSATEGVPGNDDDLDRICEPVQEGMECMGNYSASCFTPLLQEVYDMLMAEPKKYQNSICSRGTDERALYLKHAPCFQKALSTDNVKPHLEDLMAALEAAAEAKFQQRVPTMCCGLQRLYNNMLGIVKSNCGDEVLKEGDKLIGMSVSSLSDIFCRGYEPDSPKCNGILPPSGTPSKGGESKVQIIQFMNTAIANWQ
ncbi:uncharacterized protein [Parasteatoda tepidariorum]|uniref:uncharacterized protein n=1 Tax=Parasteatoda tepidariorum TaxID=114398 RepID=UPI00077FC2AD|nr:uncharacterized protein LOC107454125 [Parasteatoda tepidariorum]